MLDKNKILDGVSEACRHRSVTHLILSNGAYEAYSFKLDKDTKRRGIKNSTCHDAALLPVSWIPKETDHIALGFNPHKIRLSKLLELIITEEDEVAKDVCTEMLEDDYRYLHVFHLSVEEEVEDEVT